MQKIKKFAKILDMEKFSKKIFIKNAEEMVEFGEKFGKKISGGEILELIGDVGAGKTTFVKGLARGIKIDENIQSPSFTILQNYVAPSGIQLCHYDFYRLKNPGIIKNEIAENLTDKNCVIVVEWAESVRKILPANRIQMKISFAKKGGREIEISTPKNIYLSNL